jgi:uncharacterized protein (DUF2237 family)
MLRDDRSDGERRPVAPRNVLGEPLEICSIKPITGFYRDGCCNTGQEDAGSHTVCAVMTTAFLEFSKARGNDLSTPMPELGFSGLRPGDPVCAALAGGVGCEPSATCGVARNPRGRSGLLFARRLETLRDRLGLKGTGPARDLT